jgi:ACT domain-containing protein
MKDTRNIKEVKNKIFSTTHDHDEFTGKEESVEIQVEDEDVKTQNDDIIQKEKEKQDVSTNEEEYDSASE